MRLLGQTWTFLNLSTMVASQLIRDTSVESFNLRVDIRAVDFQPHAIPEFILQIQSSTADPILLGCRSPAAKLRIWKLRS